MLLVRIAPKTELPTGVKALGKEDNKRRGHASNWDYLEAHAHCIVAETPGGIYQKVKGRWQADIFGHKQADLLVLDESSQFSLPEAMLSALPLKSTTQVIVMHDWENEPRRTFQQFRAFESVYHALLPLNVPEIKFERSFRVHPDVAEFLRREVYAQDGIAYYSTNTAALPAPNHDDSFIAAVLDPEQPVIVVHHEQSSQTVNAFEQELLSPVLEALADPFHYTLDAETSLGVVVSHRAALRQNFPAEPPGAGSQVLRR